MATISIHKGSAATASLDPMCFMQPKAILKATLVADLTRAENIPSNTFDCIICTQTLMFIYNVQAAIRTLYRILKPGGVLLATVAGVSHQISRHDMERWGDYWRFTSLSTRLLFQGVSGSQRQCEDLRQRAGGDCFSAGVGGGRFSCRGIRSPRSGLRSLHRNQSS